MKSKHTELTFSLLATLVVVVAILCFLKGVKNHQLSESADLFTLVPTDCYAFIYIDKAGNFSKLLRLPLARQIFNTTLPEEYCSIIERTKGNVSFLIAFCPEGILLYGNPGNNQMNNIKKDIFEKIATGYSPMQQEYVGSKLLYYPGKGKSFLGYSYQKGIFICSYNKKLLEKSVLQQQHTFTQLPVAIEILRKRLNRNNPASIFFQTKKYKLDIFPDSLISPSVTEGWLSADLSTRQNELCIFGSLPFREETQVNFPDSLYHSLADTLTVKLTHLFPSLCITSQITSDNSELYYSACGSSSGISTIKPSYE
ncbi:hypothetical protein [Parabacteroides pacaensis]|uniref:hypothetical protein n=1 Tax=Parabacteroides pacaensis TaxID=2086575 RepID=UPI00131C1569|nr:hypothetical protein [Parabacteroides pacaensis]